MVTEQLQSSRAVTGAAPSAQLAPCAAARVVNNSNQRRKKDKKKEMNQNIYLLKFFLKKDYIHIDNNVEFIMYKSSISLQSGKKKTNLPSVLWQQKNNNKKTKT